MPDEERRMGFYCRLEVTFDSEMKLLMISDGEPDAAAVSETWRFGYLSKPESSGVEAARPIFLAAVAGFLVEEDGLGGVLGDAEAGRVAGRDVVAAAGEPQVAGPLVEEEGAGVVFEDAGAVRGQHAQIDAAAGLSGVAGLPEIVRGAGRVCRDSHPFVEDRAKVIAGGGVPLPAGAVQTVHGARGLLRIGGLEGERVPAGDGVPPFAGLAEEAGGPLLVLGHAVPGGEEVGEVGAAEGVVGIAALLEEGGGQGLVHGHPFAVAMQDPGVEAGEGVPFLAGWAITRLAIEVDRVGHVPGNPQALFIEESEVRAAKGVSEVAGAAVGDQGAAGVFEQGAAGLFEMEPDVVAPRGIAAVAGVLIEAERPAVVAGDPPAGGVEEGQVRAARGVVAVAGLADQIEDAGVTGCAAHLVEVAASELSAAGGAAPMAGQLEELVGAYGIGRHALSLHVEDAELVAPRGLSGVAGLFIERESAGQLHRFFQDLRAPPHGELDLLSGLPGEEQALEGAGAVHGRAVQAQEPVARLEPGAGGRTVLGEVLQDHTVLTAVCRAKAGAERGGAYRTGISRAAERQEQTEAES